jgi:hypothetical protein
MRLAVETLEPKLKAHYNLSEVARILHCNLKALHFRVMFLFDVKYKLPKDLSLIKASLKREGNKYYISCYKIKKLEQLLELTKTKYKVAFYDYYYAKLAPPRLRARELRGNNTKGYLDAFIKSTHKTKGMIIRKRDSKITKEEKRKAKQKLLKKIYEKEGMNYEM